jgi:hypothetical protein
MSIHHLQRAHCTYIRLGVVGLCSEMVLSILCLTGTDPAMRLLKIPSAITARYQVDLWYQNEAEHASTKCHPFHLSFRVLNVLRIRETTE